MDIFKLKKRLACAALGTAACVALVACGGGGGIDGGLGDGGDTPSTPALSLTPQGTKTFHFHWAPVSGATHYVLLEDPDGASGDQPVSPELPASASAYDHEVFLPARVNARYVLQACNAAGCTDSAALSVSGNLAAATGYMKASIQKQDGAFGARVAISSDGNTLAVGASGDDSDATGAASAPDPLNNGAVDSGAVYVFVRNGGAWVQQAYIKAANAGAGDLFGDQVTLSADGNVLAVSAVGEDSLSHLGLVTQPDPADNSAPQAGAVYVFSRSGGAWSQDAYVKASNGQANDSFGASLALSADGSTLAVGATGEDAITRGINGSQYVTGAPYSGAVYVFIHEGSAWLQQAYIKSSNSDAQDLFGSAVALSADGDVLAVSAVGEAGFSNSIANPDPANNTAPQAGAVYMFRRNGLSWNQEAYVKASNGEMHDAFGASLALSNDGSTLAVGAPGEASFYKGVDADQHTNGAPNSGAAYVFTHESGAWVQQAYIKSSNSEAEDQFGAAIALSHDGNTMAVGTHLESSRATGINGAQSDNGAAYSGAVYVFTRSAGTWLQQAYVKAPNTDSNDQFGDSVALGGGAGTVPLTLAVGAFNEASGATGVNSAGQADNSVPGSGAVYLY